jgi:hypothetical protein
MARGISITVDRSDLRELQDTLRNIRNGAPRVIKNSVNKTLPGVRTDMARETQQRLALKQSRIKKDIKVVKRANTRDFSGRVSSKGQPVSLHSFGAKQKKKGVSVRVLKSEGRKTIRGAFIARGKHGNTLVFWREKTPRNEGEIGTKKEKPWLNYAALPERYRYPVEALHGPRIQDITARPEVMQAVEEKGRVRLKKQLASQTDRLLAKQKV